MDVKLRASLPLQFCKYLTTKMNPLKLLIYYKMNTVLYDLVEPLLLQQSRVGARWCCRTAVCGLSTVCSSVPVVPSTTTRCPTLLTYGVSRKLCARNVQTKFNNYTVSAKSPLAFLLQTVFIYRLSTR